MLRLRLRRDDDDEHKGGVSARLTEQEQKTRLLEARVKRIELEVGVIGRRLQPEPRERHA